MNGLMSWISPNAMHALGWALLHFLWEGTALAALAALAMALSEHIVRGRWAEVREPTEQEMKLTTVLS